jgi:hypothetical protein
MGDIRLQAYMGSYIKTPLNMNTSLNVYQVMRLILDRMDEHQETIDETEGRATITTTNTNATTIRKSRIGNFYFYTRPTIAPRPYGDNLVAYRSGHNIRYAIDVPDWFARAILSAVIVAFRGMASA